MNGSMTQKKRRRRRGRVNLKYQMTQAITEINKIGESKRESKKKGEHGIHSYNQIKESLSVSANFIHWAKEQGVRNLYHLTQAHYIGYIEFKRGDVSNGHLMNIETGLGHLQKGMNAISEKLGKKPVVWIAEKRLVTEREKPVDRSYTHDEIKRLMENMSPRVAKAAELSYRLGLRAREVVNLRTEHIQKNKDGNFEVCFKSENAKGLTKGARPRITPIPSDMQGEIQKLIDGKKPHERIIGLTATSTLRSGLSRASLRANIEANGWHGFRHTYSRDRLNELLGDKGILQEGHRMLQRVFDNRDRGRKTDYGMIKIEDKQIYRELKACMDQVHEEIGHGKDRWDLAEIYMK